MYSYYLAKSRVIYGKNGFRVVEKKMVLDRNKFPNLFSFLKEVEERMRLFEQTYYVQLYKRTQGIAAHHAAQAKAPKQTFNPEI